MSDLYVSPKTSRAVGRVGGVFGGTACLPHIMITSVSTGIWSCTRGGTFEAYTSVNYEYCFARHVGGVMFCGGGYVQKLELQHRGKWIEKWTAYLDGATARYMCADLDGNVTVGFLRYGDETIKQLSADGDTVKWSYDTGANTYIYWLDADASGNVFAAGKAIDYGTPTVYTADLWSFTSEGSLRWRYSAEGVATSRSLRVVADGDGGAYIIATIDDANWFVSAISSSGALRWSESIGHDAYLATDRRGNLLHGDSNSLVKRDSDGNELWSYAVDGAYEIGSIACDQTGNVYFGYGVNFARLPYFMVLSPDGEKLQDLTRSRWGSALLHAMPHSLRSS